MLDVFVIQSIFVVIFRFVLGVDIPAYAVWACLFGSGAVQRLQDNWKIVSDITGTSGEIEPSIWHTPIFQALMWWFFWMVTIWLRLVWPDTSVPSGDLSSALSYLFEQNPVWNWIGFYFWGLSTSILFDIIAFRSKLFYPVSDWEGGLNLVNKFDGKGGGWAMSIALTTVWGFILSIILLDIFWSNILF